MACLTVPETPLSEMDPLPPLTPPTPAAVQSTPEAMSACLTGAPWARVTRSANAKADTETIERDLIALIELSIGRSRDLALVLDSLPSEDGRTKPSPPRPP